MKKILVAILLSATAGLVYARCTTQTFIVNGQMTVCTVCCDNRGNCTTSCI
jgi:hypothetical protein